MTGHWHQRVLASDWPASAVHSNAVALRDGRMRLKKEFALDPCTFDFYVISVLHIPCLLLGTLRLNRAYT